MKLLIFIMLAILLFLQFRLWVGDGSLAEVWELKNSVAIQKQENEKLAETNRILDAEVTDLKTGLEAIEERARNELGMIREGETFYQVVEVPGSDSDYDE